MAVTILGMILAPTTVAQAAPLCAYDSGAHTLTVTAQSSSGPVRLAAPSPYLVVNDVNCALLTDVNNVTVNLGSGYFGNLRFDLSQGSFAPGSTDEGNGSSEIEFTVNGSWTQGWITIVGSTAGDGVTIGQYLNPDTFELVGQVNLNAGVDISADVDVVLHGAPPNYFIHPGQGNDYISGAGAGVFLSRATFVPINVWDFPGDGFDTFTGGSGDDNFSVTYDSVGEADSYSGGGGMDDFRMTSNSQYLSTGLSLDGAANDGVNCPGTSCEGDNMGTDFESVFGASSNDTLVGNDGAQTLYGGMGQDTLIGRGGDDFLIPGQGGDDVIGGPGDDVLSYRDSGDPMSVNAAAGESTGQGFDTFGGIESFIGSIYSDVFLGSDGADIFRALKGADAMFGRRGNDELFGQTGNDDLDGGLGTDLCDQGPGSGTVVACEA